MMISEILLSLLNFSNSSSNVYIRNAKIRLNMLYILYFAVIRDLQDEHATFVNCVILIASGFDE